MLIPKHATIEALKSLGDNINFIDIWHKLFEENYDVRCVAYSTAIKEMFKQIPLTVIKPVIPKHKVQKLVTKIGGEWYMKKR